VGTHPSWLIVAEAFNDIVILELVFNMAIQKMKFLGRPMRLGRYGPKEARVSGSPV
jgi:hypothetical protein